MKKALTILTFLCCYSLASKATTCIKKDVLENNIIQTTEIKIYKTDFDHLIEHFTQILQKHIQIKDVNDYITLVRLFNTVYYSDLYEVAKYKYCIDLFSPDYFQLAIEKLNAKLMKGQCHYSKQYNLWIGSNGNGTSKFVIVSN